MTNSLDVILIRTNSFGKKLNIFIEILDKIVKSEWFRSTLF